MSEVLWKRSIRRDKNMAALYLSKNGGRCETPGCPMQFDLSNGYLFEFHHKNRSEKSFDINRRTVENKGFEKCLEETHKCKLLCSHCHNQLEYGFEKYNSGEYWFTTIQQ
jgi:hypothetical protein